MLAFRSGKGFLRIKQFTSATRLKKNLYHLLVFVRSCGRVKSVFSTVLDWLNSNEMCQSYTIEIGVLTFLGGIASLLLCFCFSWYDKFEHRQIPYQVKTVPPQAVPAHSYPVAYPQPAYNPPPYNLQPAYNPQHVFNQNTFAGRPSTEQFGRPRGEHPAIGLNVSGQANAATYPSAY